MDMEMMMEEESEESYPGIQFTPPDGTVGPEESEGDALIRWSKVGDRYTIIEFEGKKVGQERVPPSADEVAEKKERRQKMDAYSELDMMAQL